MPRETRPMSDAELAADDPLHDLRTQWHVLVSPDDSPLDGLLKRHRERHRRYHNVDHVVAVVRHVADLADHEPIDDLGLATAAAWYHDAVYEPRSPANERASARLARRDLTKLGWQEHRVDAVAAMIEATATHTDPADNHTAVLFDADLSILGAEPELYSAYAAAVRSEYSHVDDGAWATGRADVLAALLDRPAIYCTDTGSKRWESPARRNITAELSELS